MVKHFFALAILLNCIPAFAQNNPSQYDSHALFAPLFYNGGGTITRAANGEPNTGYWQNKADYKITASLNDVTNEITASVVITYKNNRSKFICQRQQRSSPYACWG
jgi:hypothetical protein